MANANKREEEVCSATEELGQALGVTVPLSPVSRRHVIENEAGELPVLALEVERLEVP